MKPILGVLAATVVLGCAVVFGPGCSLINKPCSDPMSCSCATTQNPACPAWPSDDNPSWAQDAKRADGGVADASSGAIPFLDGGTSALTGDITSALDAAPPDLMVVTYSGSGDATSCMDGTHSVTPMAPGVVCLRDGLTFTEALCGMKKSERENPGKFSGSDEPWAEAIIDLMHRLPDSACGQAIGPMDISEPNCPTGSLLGVFEGGHVGCGYANGRYIGPLIHHYFPQYEAKEPVHEIDPNVRIVPGAGRHIRRWLRWPV